MSEKVAMSFKMIVDEPQQKGHNKYRTEGWLNTGLEEHLKVCFECRVTLAKDLHDFAEQIYTIAMRP